MEYSDVIEELIDETYAKSIVWENINPQSMQTIIYNYNFAFKAYKCNYSKEGQDFKLLFVEKKFPDQHTEWEGVAESYFPELIIMQDSASIGVINENNGNKDDLIRLAGAIETNNEGMNSFLGLFGKKK